MIFKKNIFIYVLLCIFYFIFLNLFLFVCLCLFVLFFLHIIKMIICKFKFIELRCGSTFYLLVDRCKDKQKWLTGVRSLENKATKLLIMLSVRTNFNLLIIT